jgi:hypothetical protein
MDFIRNLCAAECKIKNALGFCGLWHSWLTTQSFGRLRVGVRHAEDEDLAELATQRSPLLALRLAHS